MTEQRRGARSRSTELVAIALAIAALAVGLWFAGRALDSPVLSFSGLMVGATTFVPLPADSFVLDAAEDNAALTIGLVGGIINATVVLVERRWILTFVDHPAFDRFARFFENNRLVRLAERNMFLSLLLGGATFVPFEPFRLVAVMRRYSPVRYWIATFVSRGGRYYVLALVGQALLEVGFLRQAIWITLVLFAIGLWRSAVRLLRADESSGGPTVDEVSS
ncbi:MAG: hypothetical protein AAGE88_14835 [Actinomycetota bacterium]